MPKRAALVKTRDGRFQAVVRLPDGTRKRLAPFPKGTSEAKAREFAAVNADQALDLEGELTRRLDTWNGTPACFAALLESFARKARLQSTKEASFDA